MARIKTVLKWVLRIAGLIFSSRPPDAAAQKAVTNEDQREIAVAAAPDKPVDAILDAMQRNQD